MSVMRVWRAARAVPAGEWSLLLAAGADAFVVEIGLRTTTLPRLARLLGVTLATGPDAQTPEPGQACRRQLPEDARRRLMATDRVMRHWPLGDTCLRHALVSGRRIRYLHPLLRVGVAKRHGEVRAHAWLEVDGISLDPEGAAAFLPLGPVVDGRPG